MSENTDMAFLKEFAAGEHSSGDILPSGLGALLSARIMAVDLDALTIDMEFEAGEDMVHGGGVVAGGQLASMMDLAMGLVAQPKLDKGRTPATVSMNTDFHRPSRPGTYRCHGEVTRLGRSVIFTKAQLYNDEDKLTATATSILMIVDMAPKE